MGNLKVTGAALALALTALVLGSCGSDGGGDTTVAQPPPLSAETAGHLAKLSDRIATDLDTGDTCHAAHAADDLRSAIEEADLPQSMRPDVEEVAGNLVDSVNCPPPPPSPKPKKDKKKHEKGPEEHPPDEHGDHNPGHSDHGGFVPPGQAKLKGEKG